MTKAELVRELTPFEDDVEVVTSDLLPIRVEYSDGMLVVTEDEPLDDEIEASVAEAEDRELALWEGEGGRCDG